MKTRVLTTALTLSLGRVSRESAPSVADRLGKDLTPMGAEKAGTKAGVDLGGNRLTDPAS